MRARGRAPVRALRAVALAVCLLPLAAAGAQASAGPEPAPSGAAKAAPRPYAAALAVELEAAAQKSPADFARLLEAKASALPPVGAASLLLDYAPRLSDPAAVRRFLVQAGGVALIARDYPTAAKAYEAAAGAEPGKDGGAALAAAARARLASGERDQALALALKLESGQPLAAGLIRVWALLLGGEPVEARAALAAPPLGPLVALTASSAGGAAGAVGSGSTAGASNGAVGAGGIAPAVEGALLPDQRREALFLAWLLAEAPRRSAVAGVIGRDYPGTAEALIAASGSLEAAMKSGSRASLPALPHWYLSGLLAIGSPTAAAGVTAGASASGGGGSGAAPVAAPAVGAAREQESSVPKKLQLGAFSLRENAERLAAELRSKGFAPTVETGAGRSGTIYVVTVAPGKDAGATLLRLKDSGYEAYPIY